MEQGQCPICKGCDIDYGESFLQDQGIVPTRAQVTGDATQFQAQQELAKTSGKVRRALEGQEAVLASRFENAVTAATHQVKFSYGDTLEIFYSSGYTHTVCFEFCYVD